MKILIEAIPRCGSTTLMKALGKVYKCRVGLEPWLKSTYHETRTLNFLEDIPVKNVVVKTMVTQIPSDGDWEDRLNIHTEFAKQFDLVIFLGRKNKKEQIESFLHAKFKKGYIGWHGKYNFDVELLDEHYTKYGTKYDFHMSELKALAKNLGKEIIWYEDLYSGDKNRVNDCLKNLPNNISYDTLKKYIDPIHKYRTSDKILI